MYKRLTFDQKVDLRISKTRKGRKDRLFRRLSRSSLVTAREEYVVTLARVLPSAVCARAAAYSNQFKIILYLLLKIMHKNSLNLGAMVDVAAKIKLRRRYNNITTPQKTVSEISHCTMSSSTASSWKDCSDKLSSWRNELAVVASTNDENIDNNAMKNDIIFEKIYHRTIFG